MPVGEREFWFVQPSAQRGEDGKTRVLHGEVHLQPPCPCLHCYSALNALVRPPLGMLLACLVLIESDALRLDPPFCS